MPHPPKKRPEWAPEDLDESSDHGFASEVMPARRGAAYGKAPRRRRQLSVEDYVAGVLASDRGVLARAITLIESNAHHHQATAQEVLQLLLPKSGAAIRVGISGMPGAGKSTFIEALGLRLCEAGHKVAVLAIDPSSTVHGGSVLGDKVRMERLGRHPAAFIRPSPSGGALGGVARKSRETIVACEAAGYDVILVETVGVGQNEVTVRSMVDFFLLITLAGAGDEIQGIKKGIMEIADAIAVNKADGDNLKAAKRARAELARVLHYLQPATEGWTTQAFLCSAQEDSGIAELWDAVGRFREQGEAGGVLAARRKRQQVNWLHALIEESLLRRFFAKDGIRERLETIEAAVTEGSLPVVKAAEELLDGE